MAARLPAAGAAASGRHHNCFFYFRGPSTRSRDGVDRQVEDNTTKALINVLEHSDRGVASSFLKRFSPVHRPSQERAFYLQGGPEQPSHSPCGLLAISIDGEIPVDSWESTEDSGSRIDAAIDTSGHAMLAIEVKTQGLLNGAQLLRHCDRWGIATPDGENLDLPSTWRLARWREIHEWTSQEASLQSTEPSRFLLSQFAEYLALVGLAPTSRFLPEHFAFFEREPTDRPDDLKLELKSRLETLWGLVKEDLGELRTEVEPTYVGPIKAHDTQIWAQSNRGGSGVNFTIELDHRGLQLNIVAGTAEQLAQFDPWLTSNDAQDASQHELHDYNLVLFRRDPVSFLSSGQPMWRGARWTEVMQMPLTTVTTSAGDGKVAQARGDLIRGGARPGFHIRRTWSPSEVVGRGDELIPELAGEVARLVPVLRRIRKPSNPSTRSSPTVDNLRQTH